MSFAIFGGIHGNLEALEAIIKHARKNKKVKEIYFLGDAITFGADSSACLKLLAREKVKCVVGDHEQRIVRYDKAAKKKTYASAEHMNFIFNQLDREDLAFIKKMPVFIKINYKGHNIAFTHYSHDKDGVVRDREFESTEANLNKLFADYNSEVVIYGHIHKRKIIIDENEKSFICAGSSGCVKGNKTFYTYFDIDTVGGTPNYVIYRENVPFNRDRFIQKIKSTPLPDKETYALPVFGIEGVEKA